MAASKKASGRKTPTLARTSATQKRRTAEHGGHSGGSAGASNASGIRAGSKRALLVERLNQPAGARIADLTEALSWLPHTVRAALTRLRQQGYAVTRSKSKEGETVYQATPPAARKKRNRTTAGNAA
jgi:Protein of unknown function (DUF3489)